MIDRRKHIIVMQAYVPSDAEIRAEQLLKITMLSSRLAFVAALAELDDTDKLTVLATRKWYSHLFLALAVRQEKDAMRRAGNA